MKPRMKLVYFQFVKMFKLTREKTYKELKMTT